MNEQSKVELEKFSQWQSDMRIRREHIPTEVALGELSGNVRWTGDNLGLVSEVEEEYVCIRDNADRVCFVAPADLVEHPVWDRLDIHSRKRIDDGLLVAARVRREAAMRRQEP